MKKNKTKGKDIHVTDISFDVEEEDLNKLFSVCGRVRSINMIINERSGKFEGRAFISMATDAQTKDAINMLDGTLLINRCIRVRATRDKLAVEPVTETAVEKPRQRHRQPKGRRK